MTDNTDIAFWKRWYSLTGDWGVGPFATQLMGRMTEQAAQTQLVYQTYKHASDAELKALRGRHRYPLPDPQTSRA